MGETHEDCEFDTTPGSAKEESRCESDPKKGSYIEWKYICRKI